jgi:hypothetical protein
VLVGPIVPKRETRERLGRQASSTVVPAGLAACLVVLLGCACEAQVDAPGQVAAPLARGGGANTVVPCGVAFVVHGVSIVIIFWILFSQKGRDRIITRNRGMAATHLRRINGHTRGAHESRVRRIRASCSACS